MVRFLSALTLAVCLASTSALHAQERAKPLGKWERKVGKNRVTLIVEDNRLHISYAGDKAVTLHADYAMTRDGLLYGVVTSIECDEDEDEESNMNKTLFDAPFSLRFRIDESALIIHDMKAHNADSKDDLWNGRYKVVHSSASRAAIVPTSYNNMPAYLWDANPLPSQVPPPTPIAPSYSSSKDAENQPPKKTSKDAENIFNFWLGFTGR